MGLAAIFKFIVDGLKMIPADIAVAFSSFKGALGMEVYPALLGVGYIVGPKTASYMFTGSLVGWMVIIPLICLFGANISLYPAAAGTTIADLYAAGGADAIWSNYVKYIGAGAIATGGIISLIKSLPLIASTFRDAMKSMKGGSASGTSRTEKDLPMPFILGGILLIILIIWLAPAIPVSPLGALLIVIFGFFFSTVSARMVGMIGSSNNPVSGMTIATLLIATMILKATGNVGIEGMIGSMAIASVICICAAIAADTSQDLKTGYLLGATPVKQQIGELIGVIAAGLAIGGVLYLLDSAWEVPAPQATLMKMIVEGIMGGNLPWNLVFTGVFLAIALEVLRIPVMPFAIGLYLPIYLNTSCGNGGTGRTQGDLALIINIFPSDSERCIAVFHAELERVFDIFGGYAGGQGHAVRKRQRAGLFVLDHKRNSVIQVGIAAIIARVRHALVKVIVLIVFLILIGGFIRVDGDIKGVIFVDLDLIKAAAGDLALVPLEIEGNVAGDLGIGSIRACGCLLFLLDIALVVPQHGVPAAVIPLEQLVAAAGVIIAGIFQFAGDKLVLQHIKALGQLNMDTVVVFLDRLGRDICDGQAAVQKLRNGGDVGMGPRGR